MGYLTNACRYCNGDDPNCGCRCHNPSIADMEAHAGNPCDSERRD